MLPFKKKRLHPGIEYLLSSLIITIFFLSSCILKGVKPFGPNVPGNGDLIAQTIPFLYRMWDCLHGNGSLFYEWNIGLGSDFAGTLSHSSLVSPFILYLLFVPRSAVESGLVVYLPVKLICMSCSMIFFLKHDRIYSAESAGNLPMRVICGTGYALSGYCLQYIGFSWIDPAVFFPLLILCLDRFLMTELFQDPAPDSPFSEETPYRQAVSDKGEEKLFNRDTLFYTLLLALILIISIQQSYAVCLYLIIYAGLVFLFMKPRRPHLAALRIAVSSVLGLGLSCLFFLPAAVSVFSSYRAGDLTTLGPFRWYVDMLTQEGLEFFRKYYMLGSVAVPLLFAVTSLLLAAFRKTWAKQHSFFLGLLLTSCAPVFFETVNLVISDGYYASFPMRYGFMVVFFTIACASRCLRLLSVKPTLSVRRAMTVLGVIAWGAIILSQGNDLLTSYPSEITASLYDAVPRDTASDPLDRYKTIDASLSANYPMVLDVPSLSSYNPVSTEDMVFLDRMLGYSQIWVRLADTGGTTFSDALLGMNNIIARSDISGETWQVNHSSTPVYVPVSDPVTINTGESTAKSFAFYRSEFSYPHALFSSLTNFAASAGAADGTLFGSQNILSWAFFGTDLMHGVSAASFSDSSRSAESRSDTLLYEIPVNGSGMLYFYAEEAAQLEIYVNGTKAAIPNYEYENNTLYPNYYNDKLLCLGTYQDETVLVELAPNDTDPEPYSGMIGNSSYGEVHFSVLDLTAFEESTRQADTFFSEHVSDFTIKNNKISLTVDAPEDGFIYLPLYADPGWNLNVNGSSAVMGKLADTLMMVPVTAGENRITIFYCAPGAAIGLLLSLISLLLLVFVTVKKRPAGWTERFSNILYKVVLAVCAAGFILIYLIPIVVDILKIVS